MLRIEDVPKPSPRENELLVRVNASTVCAGDWRFRSADPFFVVRPMNGLLRPKKVRIPGLEFAGIVETIGAKIARFALGDRVFGSTGFRMGANAEHVCVAETRLLAKIPAGVSDEDATAIPFGGISALDFLRRAGIACGQKVLIYGASGSVGTWAVQLAKHFGAEVTGVCSGANLGLVKSLGADHIIDYTREQFAREGPIYDLVFDAVGKCGLRRSLGALKRGGTLAGIGLDFAVAGPLARLLGARKVVGGVARSQAGDLDLLADLVAAGKIRVIIDRRYPLREIAEAHQYVETGHKRGQVVITIA